jgi:RNAse (barnase) inhibitor barstar
MIFKDNDADTGRLDYIILRDGGVSLYYKKTVLRNDLDWFESEKYNIVTFDCSSWTNEKLMHDQLKEKLYFPEYYGMNFNALNDCLSDFEITKAGQIIVFENLNYIKKDLASALLNTFLSSSRQKMLFGLRFIILAKVNDPNYMIDKIGGFIPSWNGHEWFDKDRI